jgi:hypothetical protein
MVVFFMQACAYSHVQRPLDRNFEKTSLGLKVGRSHIQCVLWLFAWGDAGAQAAAKNGKITMITHADTQYVIVLFGLYSRVTTVVYGD